MTIPMWTVIGLGMGLESSTITKLVLRDPTAYSIDLDHLIVLSAQTGLESEETADKMERLIYPDLRAANVRTVQLARAGPSERDGIVVLSDTRSPTRCYIEGGPYTLGIELEQNGTLPQLAHGRRICSTKHKGFCLDAWIAQALPGQPFRHLIGFNVEEQDRVAKDLTYAGANPLRHAEHPLVDAGWGRAECDAFWLAMVGETIPKSCCSICPFACSSGGIETMLRRYRAYPQHGGYALWLEYTALALNPNMALFGRKTARAVLTADGNTAALDDCARRLNATDWSVYHVRRVLPRPPARPARSVRAVWTGGRVAALDALTHITRPHGIAATPDGEHWRAYLRRREDHTARPALEEFFTIAPAVVLDKQRASCETLWRTARDPQSQYQQATFLAA